MSSVQRDSTQLLEIFGRLVAKQFDGALLQLQQHIEGESNKTQVSYKIYFNSVPDSERPLRIAQNALEIFLHDFMSALDESEVFTLGIRKADGSMIDMKDLVTEGLKTRQMDWLEKYSKHESVIDKILDILEEGN